MITLRKSPLPTLAALCLLAFGAVAHAQNAPPPPDTHPLMAHCLAEPEKCREALDKAQGLVHKENPARCEEVKQRHQKMREECAKDPQACQEKRKAMRERFEKHRKERCKNMPGHPEDGKPGAEPAPSTPPAPPAAN